MPPDRHRVHLLSRRGRKQSERRASGRILRVHAAAMAALAVVLMAPTALATPRASDDVALAVLTFWLVCIVTSGLWRPILPMGLKGRHGAALSALVLVAVGLGVYSLALGPPAPEGHALSGRTEPMRPAMVVTSRDNPCFLARVVAVNPDLTVVLDGGDPATSSGPMLRGFPVGLAGLPPERPTREAGSAARWLREELLGSVVTVMEAGEPGHGAGSNETPGAPLYYLFPGIVDGEACRPEDSVNARVALILAGAGD